MERKNDNTILLLVAAGLGIYWYINNKKKTTDNVSTQPVIEKPITEMPSGTSVPVLRNDNQIVQTGVQPLVKEVTPVTDMFNTTMLYNYDNKNVDNAVFNMNIASIE